MANKEHLARLRKGASVWNEWREKNPRATPNLSKADLRGANLSEAYLDFVNLSRANLHSANLSNATLIGTELSEADLSYADLHRAELPGATLIRADLSGANLSWATLPGALLSGANLLGTDVSSADLFLSDLSGADLSGANLMSANLTEADLKTTKIGGATMGRTTLAGLDMSTTEGLDSVVHRAPSYVGVETLYKSHGSIPEVFLRGCGVPEGLIAYMRSLGGKTLEFYSCFISYSSRNQQFAERLHADLQSKDVRCWFAPEDMKIGQRVRDALVDAIRLRDKLLLVLSRDSVESAWVEMEVETALEEERKKDATVLFPIRLDDSVMEDKRGWATAVRQRHIGDFRKWADPDEYQKAFQRLLCDLQAGDQSSKADRRGHATGSANER